MISNLAAYLLWPRDFPETITQSIHNLFDDAVVRSEGFSTCGTCPLAERSY